jgi:hypothetical protein
VAIDASLPHSRVVLVKTVIDAISSTDIHVSALGIETKRQHISSVHHDRSIYVEEDCP